LVNSDESAAKRFRGLRFTGEINYFLENNMVQELIVCEKSAHKVFGVSMMAM
jgi:hypothetical protein